MNSNPIQQKEEEIEEPEGFEIEKDDPDDKEENSELEEED